LQKPQYPFDLIPSTEIDVLKLRKERRHVKGALLGALIGGLSVGLIAVATNDKSSPKIKIRINGDRSRYRAKLERIKKYELMDHGEY